MPRYVVLFHQLPAGSDRPSHWDLMLQRNETLATWELPRFSVAEPIEISARKLADHRLHYLNYEGPISNYRGEVRRVASGAYEEISWTEQKIAVRLVGTHQSAELELERLSASQWLVKLHPISPDGTVGQDKR